MTTEHLATSYPLRILGVEATEGIDADPNPPVPLPPDDLRRWEQMPLSKRRLASFGPEAGTSASRRAAIIVAAECRLQGMNQTTALKLCKAIPYTPVSGNLRKLLRQIPSAVAFAYETTTGEPILTGCCRDPRAAQSGAPLGTLLRTAMAPYCDGHCAATCSMLRAFRYPDRTIADTEYRHIDQSDLWMQGSGYGRTGRFVYRQLATLASLAEDRTILASASYLSLRSDGEFPVDTIRRVLRRFHDDGLATVVRRKNGKTWRVVPVLSREAVRDLERQLGVYGKRASHLREAKAERERYSDRAFELLTALEKTAAWAS